MFKFQTDREQKSNRFGGYLDQSKKYDNRTG